MCHAIGVQDRGQLAEVCSLPPCGVQRLQSAPKACQLAPVLVEPSHQLGVHMHMCMRVGGSSIVILKTKGII